MLLDDSILDVNVSVERLVVVDDLSSFDDHAVALDTKNCEVSKSQSALRGFIEDYTSQGGRYTVMEDRLTEVKNRL